MIYIYKKRDRRTDFGTKLIYPFFLKKKAGIITMNGTIDGSIGGLDIWL